MGENSKIEWTDHTFNPWIGCAKVAPECANCYAKEMMDDRFGFAVWGINGTRVRTSEVNWNDVRRINAKAKREGVRPRLFCASLADVFEDHPLILPEWRRDLFQLIEQCRQIEWLLLTKRPQNIGPMIGEGTGRHSSAWLADCDHVWVGTSVGTQKTADEMIPHLLAVNASMRFLSCEPLLEAVTLPLDGIDWVIVGGESGDEARLMQPSWARSVRDQCVAAGVSFFFKQWGEYQPAIDGGEIIRFDKVGKSRAGRNLDGRTWDEIPAREVKA